MTSGKPLELPESLELYRELCFADGGTCYLHGISESGRIHEIIMRQHFFSRSVDPGRMVFDDKYIEVRSDEEARILDLLKSATIPVETPDWFREGLGRNAIVYADEIREFYRNLPKGPIRRIRDAMVEFFESDEYVEIATNGIPDPPASIPRTGSSRY